MNKITIISILFLLTISTSIVYRLCNQKWLDFSRAEYYYKKKLYDKAVEYYLASMQEGLEPSHLIGNLSKSLLLSDRYQKNFSLFESLKKKAPENAKAFSILGNFFFSIENYQESIKAYQYALKLNSENNAVRYGLALSLSRSGKYDEAILEYKALLGEK